MTRIVLDTHSGDGMASYAAHEIEPGNELVVKMSDRLSTGLQRLMVAAEEEFNMDGGFYEFDRMIEVAVANELDINPLQVGGRNKAYTVSCRWEDDLIILRRNMW